MFSDFVFDGQRASDYGLIFCLFDTEYQPATGGEAEFETVKPPNSDDFVFYGSQYNTPLEWTFSVMKNNCSGRADSFSTQEERLIRKWLERRDGYYWFHFCKDDDDEDNILYKVQIKVASHIIGGKTVGFDLAVTSNSAFGYTELQKRNATISSSNPLTLYIDTDTNAYILPYITIAGSGNFYISNDNDPVRNYSSGKAASFTGASGTITMDSENLILDGLSLDKFNGYFLRLVDGENVIRTNSYYDISLEIYYREVRRAIT